ncbi:MAG: endonuclease/exonuclease/phosphatase family protein [Pirellulaceae bacterium]
MKPPRQILKSVRRYSKHVAWVGLLVLFVPYVVSRIASPMRQIVIHDLEASNTPTAHLTNQTLRIVTYNIAHGRGESDSNWTGETLRQRSDRFDDIAALLTEIDADIVVLNEADFDTSWSDHVDQALYLANQAGYRYVVEQRNLDFRILGWTWRFGNAVLSKHPISDTQVIDLPGYAAWETVLAGKKRAIDCNIQFNSNQSFRLIAAHLSPRSEHLRVDSMDKIIRLATQSKTPVIIAGDLNAAPPGFSHWQSDVQNRNAINQLDASKLFQRLPLQDKEAGTKTYPAHDPDRVIDWIVVSNDWPILSYQVIPSTLSDHRPVVAEVAPSYQDNSTRP